MKLNSLLYLLYNLFGIERHIKSLVIVNCWHESNNIRLSKELSKESFSVLLIRLNQLNTSYAIHHFQNGIEGLDLLGVYLDYNCATSEEFIESCRDCFSTRFKWLIHDSDNTIDERSIFEQLGSINLFVDAEVMCITSDSIDQSLDESYSIYDVFNNALTHGGKLNITFDRHFIVPSGTNGYLTESIIRKKPKYVNRNAMTDVTLRIGLLLPNHERFEHTQDVLQYLLTDNNTSVDTLARYGTNMGFNIKDALSFNASYVRFSKWAANDTYGGLIEGIATDKVDFGIGLLVLWVERQKYFSVITQLAEFRSRLYFLTMTDIDLYGRYFLMPFVQSVWICVILVVALVSIVLRIIQSHDKLYDGSSTLLTFGAFCLQGASSTPRLVSGRCLLIFLLLTAYCIASYYTSVLVSTLVKSGTKNKINSIKDLEDSPLKVGFDDHPFIHGFLNSTKDPQFLSFIAKKVNLYDNSYYVPTPEGVRLVQEQRYAFHCEANTANPLISKTFTPRQICNLNVIPFRREKDLAFVLRKNSPFHDIFAVKMFWMREIGMISKYNRHWMAPQPPCLSSALFSNIEFNSTVASVELLIVGYLLSILILLIEIAWHQQTLYRTSHLTTLAKPKHGFFVVKQKNGFLMVPKRKRI